MCVSVSLFLLRLLNLFAEEMTIEDTYYYLMEALRKNTIELEAFLKVRLAYDLWPPEQLALLHTSIGNCGEVFDKTKP